MSKRVAAVLLAVLSVALLPATARAEGRQSLVLYCEDHEGFLPEGAVPSMEASYWPEPGGCWQHIGMHTYFPGVNKVYRLHGGSGFVNIVEQYFTAPTELVADGTATRMAVETSLDGLTWTEAATVAIPWTPLTPSVGTYEGAPALTLDAVSGPVRFSFTADGELFRFLRLRESKSASQGLAGFMDHSEVTLDVSVASKVDKPVLSARRDVAKTCAADILEDVFAEHPCTYGGIHDFDAPSFYHTYPLGGPARLDRIRGQVTVGLFRTGYRFVQGRAYGVLFYDTGPEPVVAEAAHTVEELGLNIQVSEDGTAFRTVGTVQVRAGVPATFDVAGLAGARARFVRLVSDPTAEAATVPSRKYAEAYIVHSGLTLDGMLPCTPSPLDAVLGGCPLG